MLEHHHVRTTVCPSSTSTTGKHQGNDLDGLRAGFCGKAPRAPTCDPRWCWCTAILDARQQDEHVRRRAPAGRRYVASRSAIPPRAEQRLPGRGQGRADAIPGCATLRRVARGPDRSWCWQSAGGNWLPLALTGAIGSRYGMGLITCTAPMDLGWWRRTRRTPAARRSCRTCHRHVAALPAFNCGKRRAGLRGRAPGPP